jgi:serine/threonine protein kinase
MSFPNITGFRIIKALSESTRVNVYLAEQTSLQRVIALKVLNDGVGNDLGARMKVIEEGKSAAQLTHPNLLGVYDIGESEGRYYIATEHVSGGSLRDRMQSGVLKPDQEIEARHPPIEARHPPDFVRFG